MDCRLRTHKHSGSSEEKKTAHVREVFLGNSSFYNHY